MAQTDVSKLAAFVEYNQFSYHSFNKDAFFQEARKLARRIAADLGMTAGTFEVRMNRAGIGSSGEVVLHADHLYVQLDAEIDLGRGRTFMFRGCRSMRDFTGLTNRWALWRDLAHRYDAVMEEMRSAMREGAAALGKGGEL